MKDMARLRIMLREECRSAIRRGRSVSFSDKNQGGHQEEEEQRAGRSKQERGTSTTLTLNSWRKQGAWEGRVMVALLNALLRPLDKCYDDIGHSAVQGSRDGWHQSVWR